MKLGCDVGVLAPRNGLAQTVLSTSRCRGSNGLGSGDAPLVHASSHHHEIPRILIPISVERTVSLQVDIAAPSCIELIPAHSNILRKRGSPAQQAALQISAGKSAIHAHCIVALDENQSTIPFNNNRNFLLKCSDSRISRKTIDADIAQ